MGRDEIVSAVLRDINLENENMHYFLYGEDTYSLRESLHTLEEKYRISQGEDANIIKLAGGKLTKEGYFNAINSTSFFTEKSFIEVANLQLDSTDQKLKSFIADNLDRIPESATVVFVEYGLPDKRTALFKKLHQSKHSREYPFLDEHALRSWISQKVSGYQLSIAPAAIVKLQIGVGADLWRMSQEIEKIALYKKSIHEELITDRDVDLFVRAEASANIFQFVDAVATKNLRLALISLHTLLEAGENEIYVLTMIIYQYRNMLMVQDQLARGASQQDIPKILAIHPFVAKKTISSLNRYSLEELKAIYQKLAEFDESIKSGKLEPSLALDLLVVDICKK
ncbi:MAG: DNA polymerase III subunit delta [bacterium ADurb.Bin400]|nr:MAG: DNA polymerase III subunit delta [bacterium ADurb.Bin400]